MTFNLFIYDFDNITAEYEVFFVVTPKNRRLVIVAIYGFL